MTLQPAERPGHQGFREIVDKFFDGNQMQYPIGKEELDFNENDTPNLNRTDEPIHEEMNAPGFTEEDEPAVNEDEPIINHREDTDGSRCCILS